MAKVYDDVLTIEEYLNLIGMKYYSDIDVLCKLSEYINEYADEQKYGTIWDYPLNKIEHILEQENMRVALVTNGIEYRWFEIPQ